MLNVRELVDAGKAIYVRNKTGRYVKDKYNRPNTTEYVLEIHKDGRTAAKVVIPATKYPYCLSQAVPPSMLRDSPELYALIEKGILEIVDPDKARAEMADPMAEKAMEHAMRRLQPVVHRPTAAPALDNARKEGPPTDKEGDGRKEAQLQIAPNEDVDVSATIKQVVLDLDSDISLKDEKLLELMNMSGLTDDDLGYLLANCRAGNIKRWARTELAGRVGEEDVQEFEAEVAQEDEPGEEEPRRVKKMKRFKKRTRR